MRITRIDVSDVHYDPPSAHHVGHVSMELQPPDGGAPVQMHFLCRAAGDGDRPARQTKRALVDDALRQARRMPGFRRGERRIELAVDPGAPEGPGGPA